MSLDRDVARRAVVEQELHDPFPAFFPCGVKKGRREVQPQRYHPEPESPTRSVLFMTEETSLDRGDGSSFRAHDYVYPISAMLDPAFPL